ncbi:hypothetical protein GQ54DRAFT_299025 [Martensiomyces pterosporus]|nr:hypothetical protein GQ54DRAFT_299025 [Martensiomyces pterosporus]
MVDFMREETCFVSSSCVSDKWPTWHAWSVMCTRGWYKGERHRKQVWAMYMSTVLDYAVTRSGWIQQDSLWWQETMQGFDWCINQEDVFAYELWRCMRTMRETEALRMELRRTGRMPERAVLRSSSVDKWLEDRLAGCLSAHVYGEPANTKWGALGSLASCISNDIIDAARDEAAGEPSNACLSLGLPREGAIRAGMLFQLLAMEVAIDCGQMGVLWLIAGTIAFWFTYRRYNYEMLTRMSPCTPVQGAVELPEVYVDVLKACGTFNTGAYEDVYERVMGKMAALCPSVLVEGPVPVEELALVAAGIRDLERSIDGTNSGSAVVACAAALCKLQREVPALGDMLADQVTVVGCAVSLHPTCGMYCRALWQAVHCDGVRHDD